MPSSSSGIASRSHTRVGISIATIAASTPSTMPIDLPLEVVEAARASAGRRS